MQAAPRPDGAPGPAPANSGLPHVESPPLSPAAEIPAAAEPSAAPALEPIALGAPIGELDGEPDGEPAAWPRLVLRPRHKRYALLAATVAVAAAFGALAGTFAGGGSPAPAQRNVAALEENKAMVQSIARLAKEITTLKASLDQTNKASHSQIAKISERLDHASAEVTGSISAPRTIAPQALTPLPQPRPGPRLAAMESVPPVHAPIVLGWTIRDAHGGYVYVENHGDIYRVEPGAPLPGLGPVQAIKQQDGRWLVQTPRGIIVSLRDRRYFEDF